MLKSQKPQIYNLTINGSSRSFFNKLSTSFIPTKNRNLIIFTYFFCLFLFFIFIFLQLLRKAKRQQKTTHTHTQKWVLRLVEWVCNDVVLVFVVVQFLRIIFDRLLNSLTQVKLDDNVHHVYAYRS